MNTNKLINFTKNIVYSSLNSSNDIIKRSRKFRIPSKKANQIGSSIGILLGVVFIITSAIGFILGKTVWPIGTLIAGLVTVLSNIISLNRKIYKNKNR